IINVALGGTLIQHMEEHAPSGPRDLLQHGFRVAPGSKLASLLGASASMDLRVNSHHHQAVKALGEGLVAVAWSEDGTVEGIEAPGRRWLVAVQFHPEDLVPRHDASRTLLEEFVAACRSRLPEPRSELTLRSNAPARSSADKSLFGPCRSRPNFVTEIALGTRQAVSRHFGKFSAAFLETARFGGGDSGLELLHQRFARLDIQLHRDARAWIDPRIHKVNQQRMLLAHVRAMVVADVDLRQREPAGRALATTSHWCPE
ncbi:MAG: gamma-glutamyl-gamma-aminobutyrate hydrolase family protein, partial [Mycobacterium sp.]|nr:gamma-glutamyl-gamma-aminobutyrate hydrolase family protein [Mycobacterium sp.]